MGEQEDSAKSETARRGLKRLDATATEAAKTARGLIGAAAKTGKSALSKGRETALETLDKLQTSAGEDYREILSSNPLVVQSLTRAPLLVEGRPLLSTAFNLPWATATLWMTVSGTASAFQDTAGHALGGLFHYGPGHIERWDEINRYMDSVAGSGHRLKFGHSVEFLPEIVERFGIEGVPAFFCHLMQDFTSVDGIPVVPNSWAIKRTLELAAIPPTTATALVSLSASNVLAGILIAAAVAKVWRAWEREKRKRALLQAAESAIESHDYLGAIESYKRALDLERTPVTLVALGEVYLRKKAYRPYAHRAFTEAVELLGTNPATTLPYHGAQVSLRGIAALQSLATADVIGDRYPQYWQEQVEALVNAAVHSFASAASLLEGESERWLANQLRRPPLFSAAINRYLAAHVACQYPLLEERHRVVNSEIRKALSLVGRIARHDEETFARATSDLRGVWARTVLLENEADLLLAT